MIIFVLASFCSVEKSNQVSKFLKTSLYPLMDELKISKGSLPDTCPFRIPESEDIFKNSSNLIKRESVASYECLKCNKLFRSNSQLNDHISRTHSNIKGQCFGDFCEFLPCEAENELSEHRCVSVMLSCFKPSHAEDFLKLCKYREASIWDVEFKRPWVIILSILFAVGCFVYYLILWAEMEEIGVSPGMKSKKRQKSKTS